MVRRTVSQEVARQLVAAGARYCFTVPAEPILPLLDDLAEAGLRVVTARHENGAAYMAEALAQSTGRPQVVAVSRAVGASNAAVGIHTAQQDSAPLVALAGQVETSVRGREAFQEADLIGSIGSLATWSAQIEAADQAPAVLAKAWRRMNTGRPGPVLLSLPVDVQTQEVELLDGATAQTAGRTWSCRRPLRSQPCHEAVGGIRARRHRGRWRRAARTRHEAARGPVGSAGRAGHRSLAPAGRIPQRPCQLPRHGRLVVGLDRTPATGRCRRHPLRGYAPVGDQHRRLCHPWSRYPVDPRGCATTRAPRGASGANALDHGRRVALPRLGVVGPACCRARQRDAQPT